MDVEKSCKAGRMGSSALGSTAQLEVLVAVEGGE
jgi:hypothetical protein